MLIYYWYNITYTYTLFYYLLGDCIDKTLKNKEGIIDKIVEDCNYSKNLSIQKEVTGKKIILVWFKLL